MHRRDFLFLRTERSRRVAHLSCEKLFMHYQHALFTLSPADQSTAGRTPIFELDDDEPSAEFAARTPELLWADIQRSLAGVHVLRVVDTGWLAADTEQFRRDVETLVEAFRREGGTVEYENDDAHAPD